MNKPDVIFNPSPTVRPLLKERVLWVLVLGISFFLVYGSCNQIASLSAPHPSFFLAWEAQIPFIPAFIVPYMSSDLAFVIAFLITPDRATLQKFGLRCGLAITLSAILFLLIPLQFSFDKPEVSGWTEAWFNALSLDKPYNQFPSLHVSLGFLVWRTIYNAVPTAAKWAVTSWFLLILASTLLTYQHHSIDLVGGALMTWLIYRLIPEQGRSHIPLCFVTPRHLHMALRYLIIATIMTITAFNSGAAWALLFGWIAISMLAVSASYTLGLNGFLRKNGRYHPVSSWLFFWPYLLGSWLNWCYWKPRVTLMAAVEPRLWLGARPGRRDWRQVQNAGITSVIDLAPELAATTPGEIHHHHIPLLDIAIPAPEHLDKIALNIEQQRKKGGVLVHCALGMSRSVLGIAAWMIHQGISIEEVLTRLDKIRPERVHRPYMEISIRLYAQYLAGKTTS